MIFLNEFSSSNLFCIVRCLVPTIDQTTGIKDPQQESWKILRRYSDSSFKNHPIISFSYRCKPDTYGVYALFGIDLAPTDDKSDVAGVIRVGDSIRVTKTEPNFWMKNNLKK